MRPWTFFLIFTLAFTCFSFRSFLPDQLLINSLTFEHVLWIRIWIQLGQWSQIRNRNPHPYPGLIKQICPRLRRYFTPLAMPFNPLPPLIRKSIEKVHADWDSVDALCRISTFIVPWVYPSPSLANISITPYFTGYFTFNIFWNVSPWTSLSDHPLSNFLTKLLERSL